MDFLNRLVRSRPWVALAAAFVAGALAISVIWAGALISTAAGSDLRVVPSASPSPGRTESATPSASPRQTVTASSDCPRVTVPVGSAEQLEDALADAAPGDVIGLAAGIYIGNFVASTSGTADDPIYLCGTSATVLDGGDPENGYVFHLDGAEYWNLDGFAVMNGQKGVMADGTVGSVIRGLTVSSIGDEAIHLRRFSTDNLVIGNTISDTGLRKPKFGEGIYIGTAESNWCDISDCQPDNSDRNTVTENDIFDTTSESIDIKEGTSDGVVSNNTFDGSSISGDPDSWVDVKGNGWLIEGNVGTNSPLDGFQTHEILDGWGTRNVFRNNTATVNGSGFGFSLTPVRDNVVECNNTASAAGEGLSNVDCSSG